MGDAFAFARQGEIFFHTMPGIYTLSPVYGVSGLTTLC